MASLIKVKRSNSTGVKPTGLSAGELAINTFDKVLYSSDGTTVFELSKGGGLANTNSFIKSQLANTNSFIATKVNTTTFNSALANTNTFIATKTSTTTFNSALANTNSFIKSQLANTNTFIATKVNTTTFNSALANTNTFIATKTNSASPTTSGVFAHTGRATISTNLNVSGNTVVSKLVANGSVGTAGYVLKSTGSGVYWDAAVGSGTVISLTTTALKDLTQNDTVVTSAQTISASGYLQVANAVSTFQTKSIERAALANTNSYIRSQLANTNAYIAGGITSASRTANATPVSTLGGSLNLQDLIVANPAGYLSLVIGGNTYKVPYFA